MNRIRAALLVGTLIVVGSGCGGSDSTEDSSPPEADAVTTTTAAPATAVPATDLVPAEGATYVALGSSIASGFGISVQSTSCGRSDRDYPQLVAAEFGLALTDVSCGAAVIPNVVDTPQGDNPPQIDAVSPDTALITVTVGGNDISYNGSALACSDPTTVCDEPEDLEAKVAGLRPQLTSMVEVLRTAAPDATIVLVTYPREFPEENCPALSLDEQELTMLRSMGEQLQDAFIDVAEETGVILVDPYGEPGDHTGCASESDRWVSGATAADGDGFAFHPTALGHEVMAQEVIAALTS